MFTSDNLKVDGPGGSGLVELICNPRSKARSQGPASPLKCEDQRAPKLLFHLYFIQVEYKNHMKGLMNYIEIIICSFLKDFAVQQAAADLSLLSSFGSSTSFGSSFDSFPSVPVFSSVAFSLNWTSFSLEWKLSFSCTIDTLRDIQIV